jgi:hypothetical protein
VKFIAGLVGLFSLVMAGAAAAAIGRKQQIVPIEDESANDVALVAIFGPLAFHSTAGAFRGGTLDCWYGGGIVDLRDATLDEGGAHIDVKAVFGGAQILVPDTWRVESTVGGLGGARDVRPSAERPVTAPLLTLSGFVAFGGLGVSSDIPKEALDGVNQAVAARKAKENGSSGTPVTETIEAPPAETPGAEAPATA